MDKSQLFSTIKEGLEKFTSRYGTLTEELNAVRKQFLAPDNGQVVNLPNTSSETQEHKSNEESYNSEELQELGFKLPMHTELSSSDISAEISSEDKVVEKTKQNFSEIETSEYKSSDETEEEDVENEMILEQEVLKKCKSEDIQYEKQNKAVKFNLTESGATSKENTTVEDEKINKTSKVSEDAGVRKDMTDKVITSIDNSSSSYCSPESSDLEEDNIFTELLKRVEDAGNTRVSVRSYDSEADGYKTNMKTSEQNISGKDVEVDVKPIIKLKQTKVPKRKVDDESDDCKQNVDRYIGKSVNHSESDNTLCKTISHETKVMQHQGKGSKLKSERKKPSKSNVKPFIRKENDELYSVVNEFKSVKIQNKKKPLATTNKLKSENNTKDVHRVKVKKSEETNLKIGKSVVKNKAVKTTLYKKQPAQQLVKMNNSNKKPEYKLNIPAKNVHKYSAGDGQQHNKPKVSQSAHRQTLKIDTSKMELCTNVSNVKLDSLKSSTKAAGKHVDQLIKGNPDNLFLRKETKASRQTPSGLGDKGGGDVPEKLRIQEIIYSMNQSINNLKSTNVPSHFVKIKDVKQKDKSSVKTTDAHSYINKNINNESNNEQNKETKGSVQSKQMKTLLHEQIVTNIKEKCNTAKVSTHKSLEEYDILQRGNTANPKEILARLEEQVSYDKNKDCEDTKARPVRGPPKKAGPLAVTEQSNRKNQFVSNEQNKRKGNQSNATLTKITVKDKLPPTVEPAAKVQVADLLERLSKPKQDRSMAKDSEVDWKKRKDQAVAGKQVVPHETMSKIKNKMVALDFDESKLKLKLDNFPFILGQSTSRSYNVQANLQQTLSMMMMLPAENVRKTLSEESKIPSNHSTQSVATRQSHEEKCPACIVRQDNDEETPDQSSADPWDTELTSKKFVRCTCMPRDTVNFRTVMRQLLVEASVGSMQPISETSTLFEEPIDKNDDNKNDMIVYRRNDLNRLIKILHTTQGIRERLVT